MKEYTAHKPKAGNLTMESRDQPQHPSGLLSQVTGHLLASFASAAQSDQSETSLSNSSSSLTFSVYFLYALQTNENQGAHHPRKPRI